MTGSRSVSGHGCTCTHETKGPEERARSGGGEDQASLVFVFAPFFIRHQTPRPLVLSFSVRHPVGRSIQFLYGPVCTTPTDGAPGSHSRAPGRDFHAPLLHARVSVDVGGEIDNDAKLVGAIPTLAPSWACP